MSHSVPLTAAAPTIRAAEPARVPGVRRRVALAAAGLVAAGLPLSWTISSIGLLVTGTEADHRFHQLTGQGVALGLLWLTGLGGTLVAAFRGRTAPDAALAWLGFLVAGVIAGVLAPSQALIVPALLVPAALVWWALPARPRLRGRGTGIDPVLTPLALLATGPLIVYALHQAALQRTSTNEHAKMSHYFDMSWLSIAIVIVALLAAFRAGSRLVAGVVAMAMALLGTAGLAFDTSHSPAWWAVLLATAAVFGLRAVFTRQG
jgi:hypothetical protein